MSRLRSRLRTILFNLFVLNLIALSSCQSSEVNQAAVAEAVQTAIASQPEQLAQQIEVTRLVEVTKEVEVEVEVTREVEVEITRLVEVVVTATPTETPIPTETPTPAPIQEVRVFTAQEVLDALKNSGVPIGENIAFTAETDPNELLGRPGQYLSKINFRDTRLAVEHPDEFSVQDGGSIEVFPNSAGAAGRAQYLQTFSQSLSFLAEYDFQQGPVLLRLSHRLTPEQAQVYADILAGLSN